MFNTLTPIHKGGYTQKCLLTLYLTAFVEIAAHAALAGFSFSKH
jgi:hypothetical protein